MTRPPFPPISKPESCRGTLFLVPTTLDFGVANQAPLQNVLPAHSLQMAAKLSHWICEDAKSTRAFLGRVHALYPLATPLQTQHIQELPREIHKRGDHRSNFDGRALLAPVIEGHDMGLVSEAGMPAVADPGSSIVRAAHDLGIRVVPLVGPVSLLLALAASGLNGQNFAFVGYLPQDAAQRAQSIRNLEALALKTGQTQLFIETPYRNPAMLESLLHTLAPQTRLAVSCGLTLDNAQLRSDTVKHWRQRPTPVDKRVPAVFAIGS